MASIRICRAGFAAMLLAGMTAANVIALNAQKCEQPNAVFDATYKPGQVWAYKTRSGEGSSTITILRVESLSKVGVVVHVRVDGFRFKNCTGGPAPISILHAPFSKDAIDKSVLRFLRTDENVPDYDAGYQDWLSNCGGVYTIAVAEMLDVDDATFRSSHGCSTK